MPARGPHPGKMSATADTYLVDPDFIGPDFVDSYFANLAGSPTIVTVPQTAPITLSARSSSDWPPKSKKALSVFAPMRELFPPARMKPVRDSAIRDIWKRISLARRYTKVTCSELPSRRKMEMFDW